MDVQLKELLEKINKDGVQTAEQKASEIVSAAEKKAASIIEAAKKDAEKIVSDANTDAARAEAGGKAALSQAGRDLVLKTKAELEALFNGIIKTDVEAAMAGKVLEEAVMTVVKGWADKGEYVVELSAADYEKLGKGLSAKLAAELKNGTEIKPFAGVDSGFRLTDKDGGSYFNFTAEAVAANLAELLNPTLAEILGESTKE